MPRSPGTSGTGAASAPSPGARRCTPWPAPPAEAPATSHPPPGGAPRSPAHRDRAAPGIAWPGPEVHAPGQWHGPVPLATVPDHPPPRPCDRPPSTGASPTTPTRRHPTSTTPAALHGEPPGTATPAPARRRRCSLPARRPDTPCRQTPPVHPWPAGTASPADPAPAARPLRTGQGRGTAPPDGSRKPADRLFWRSGPIVARTRPPSRRSGPPWFRWRSKKYFSCCV